MSQKFKAVVIDNQNEKFSREIKEIDTSHLKDGNVLVKVDYSSLNFKDALILNNGGKIVRKFPFVPGIDFSGTVVESEDSKFKKDDKVILTGFRVGEAYFGGFAQYAKVDSNFLIKMPKDLDAHKSMMNFMKEFSDEFSFDKYPMNKKTYQNLDKIDIKSVNDRLNEFSKYINDVSEKFSSSISQGNKILDVTSK